MLETTEIGGLKTPFAKGKVNGCGGASRKAEAAKGSTCALSQQVTSSLSLVLLVAGS
ncbi:hypothetical protein N8446_02615 [Planktomarina temperata]|nr:hypothetical protein [Planktomarina temperata]